jgi:hypothetical protein
VFLVFDDRATGRTLMQASTKRALKTVSVLRR